ncbi:MAG: hypothetical protein JOZ92_10540, partial [Candidatus Dormibacteraeota bacterium]|nr:hypothetical protein [Candidatus Dormibacteraeota bacterium]
MADTETTWNRTDMGMPATGDEHIPTAGSRAEGNGSQSERPLPHGPIKRKSNQDWWPNWLDIDVLHRHSQLSNPMGAD